MVIEQNKRFGVSQQLIGFLALICFMSLFAFSPVLHAHELDYEHSQNDCAPCHWTHSLSGDTTSNIHISSFQFNDLLPLENISLHRNIFFSHFAIRAPPQVS